MPDRTKLRKRSDRMKQMELLHKIGLEIVSVFDLDLLTSTVAREVKKTLGYDNCAIFLIDGAELILESACFFPKKIHGKRIAIGDGIVGRCARERASINIADVSRCAFYIPSGLKNIRSEIATPIIFGDKLLGVMTIESTRKNAFSEEDERVLSILSSLLGVTIRNAQLTRSKEKEMRLLHTAGLKIVSKIELQKLLSTILNLIRKSLGYDNCAIFLPFEDTVIVKAQSHFPKNILGLEIKIGEGIVGRCAQKKKMLNIGNVPDCGFYIPSGLAGIQSALAIPILFENRLLGILATESYKKHAYGDEDVRLLSILSSQIGVALRNAEMHAELQKKVITDSLTGLFNHRFFIDRLEQEAVRARRYGRPLSLILLDLDNFKLVNDLFGHLKGDEVLIATARLIMRHVRKSDKSAIMKDVEIDIPVRYGGEEFMIILPETPLPGALIAAERMRKLIREEINREIPLLMQNGEKLLVTGSFGVASLKGDEKSQELIRRVDQAMYEAKRRGKDQVCSEE